MTAKYIEIPINSQAASGVMDLVINSRASDAPITGTNAALGNVATTTNAQSGTGYPTPPGGGVATATGGSQPGSGSGMTVTFTQAGGIVQTDTMVIVAAGAGYAAGDTGTITTGDGAATYLIVSVDNSAATAVVNDANALFITGTFPVAQNDVIYQGSAAVGVVLSIQSDVQLTCTSALFPTGGETYSIRTPKRLNSTGATFTARKVRIGDRVDNTSAATNTTVSALINETSLTLTADIFAGAGEFDDNFTITPLATEIYDPTATFLTTVTADDVAENTTDSVSGTITAIIDDFRINTSQAAMFGDGDSYTVFDQSSLNFPLFSADSFVWATRSTNLLTKIYLDVNNSLDVINITHSDQGTGRLVAAAIENTLIRGAIGIDLPEPPGPAVARVLMPIFGGSQIVVDTVVLEAS
jgi:hypothetical protein|tara:strand:- start:9514 stop:10752 length:1239 start_codon:yes stop_codon:yes gene_type:complete